MAKRKMSAREVRRAGDRAVEKLWEAREKLATLEAGGAPARPLEVASASVIEGQARSLGCARGCEGEARLVDHEAKVIDGERFRVVKTSCSRCGGGRTLFFSLRPEAAN